MAKKGICFLKITNVKGVVWDLDGTLLDSFSIFSKILEDVVVESGHAMPSDETILHNFHGSLEDCIKSILGIDSTIELNAVIDIFLREQEKHYSDDLETHLYKDATVLAGSCAEQGMEQLVLTNKFHVGRGSASPKFIIAATTLSDYIHEIRPGDEVEYRKPDKRSMGDWLNRHNLKPSDILVIGDQFVDAQLALNIGARSLIIKRSGDIPHIETLTDKNHDSIILVDGLDEVELTKSS